MLSDFHMFIFLEKKKIRNRDINNRNIKNDINKKIKIIKNKKKEKK